MKRRGRRTRARMRMKRLKKGGEQTSGRARMMRGLFTVGSLQPDLCVEGIGESDSAWGLNSKKWSLNGSEWSLNGRKDVPFA